MRRVTQSIKRYFVVLLATSGCLLSAGRVLAEENTGKKTQPEPTSAPVQMTATQPVQAPAAQPEQASIQGIAAQPVQMTAAQPVQAIVQAPAAQPEQEPAAVAVEPEKRGVRFFFGSDLVSSYIWRGFYNAGASIQPTLGLRVGGFAFTAWGSVDFTSSSYKEADLTASYTFKGLTLSLTDYYWTGAPMAVTPEHPAPSRKYFRFGADTPHRVEVGASYCFGERFPLSVSWYTMLFGADKNAEGKQCYSTYAEVAYPFSVKGVDMNTWVGFTPWETSGTYGTTEFAVCNVGIGATKAIRFSDKFSLPIFTRLMWNPATDDVHFVGGLSVML